MEPQAENQNDSIITFVGEDGDRFSVDMSDKEPINNPACKHVMVEDPSDQTDDFIAYVCKKCGRGRLASKTKHNIV